MQPAEPVDFGGGRTHALQVFTGQDQRITGMGKGREDTTSPSEMGLCCQEKMGGSRQPGNKHVLSTLLNQLQTSCKRPKSSVLQGETRGQPILCSSRAISGVNYLTPAAKHNHLSEQEKVRASESFCNPNLEIGFTMC